jgi:hypothetical protein
MKQRPRQALDVTLTLSFDIPAWFSSLKDMAYGFFVFKA